MRPIRRAKCPRFIQRVDHHGVSWIECAGCMGQVRRRVYAYPEKRDAYYVDKCCGNWQRCQQQNG